MKRSTPIATTLQELGSELRTIRKNAGVQANDVARQLHISPAKLSKIENGNVTPSEPDVLAILTLFDVPSSKQEQLIQAHREIVLRRRFGLRRPGTYLVNTIEEIEEATAGSRRVRAACARLIPWFVQTPRYIELYYRRFNPDLSPPEVDKNLVSRLKRQAEVFGHQREYEIIMFESVFESSLSADAGYGELSQSIQRCGALPHVDLRIVPSSKVRLWIEDVSVYETTVVTDVFNCAAITSDSNRRRAIDDELTAIRSISVGGEEALEIVNRYAERERHPKQTALEVDLRQT